MKSLGKLFSLTTLALSISACSSVNVGGGDKAPISGAAVSSGDGEKSASSGSGELHRCAKNYGRLAIEEQPMNQQTILGFSQMGLSSFSPTPLARHAAMQSGCFTLVDRGASFAMGERERELTGEKGGSKNRKTTSARWSLKVEVPQPTTQTGRGGGALLGLIPGVGGLLSMGVAAVAGSMKFSEAQVMLTVVDLETSEIVASITGTGKSSDFGIGGGFLSGISGFGGGSSQTPEMKVVAAGFVDAFNQLIPFMDNLANATSTPDVPAAAQEIPTKKVASKKKS